MLRLLGVLVVLSLAAPVNAQSAFTILRAAKSARVFKPSVICRQITTPRHLAPLATAAALQHNPTYIKTLSCKPTVTLKTEFKVPILKRPETLYGGYNYMRAITTLAKEKNAVEAHFQPIWKRINQTKAYNGVHHIVTKNTLKTIYYNLPEYQRASINLTSLQNNAPASFHIYHGNPHFTSIFHNAEAQVAIYNKHGMKAVILDYYDKINYINAHGPLEIPQIPNFVIEGTLLESELWCKTFGLRWE